MCYLKIDELKVNSYGKLKNKDIERTPEINKVKDVELELEV